MFDGEHGIALHAMQGNRPHLAAREKSHGFPLLVEGTWGIFLSYGGDGHSKLVFVQRRQDSCPVTRDISGISTKLGRPVQMLLEVRLGTEGPFLVATVILRFLSIFKKGQALSPFEALNSA